MAETLLSFTEVLLFGRIIEDLTIRDNSEGPTHQAIVAATGNVPQLQGHRRIDGVRLENGNQVLVPNQRTATENGLYSVGAQNANWTLVATNDRETIYVEEGKRNGETLWTQTAANTFIKKGGLSGNNLLDSQLSGGSLARIYGFSYEGCYYDLPTPTVFLVHGPGRSATDGNAPTNPAHAARAPTNPSISGVAAAEFQFADDIRVWPYDKADYSIRMDVMTGQLEEILLEVFFGIELPEVAGGRVAGGRVAGGRVAGGRVAGGRVAGGRVAGGRVSGGRVSGSD